MNDEEITVAEFDAFYKTEIILFISEDDLGNKYIEVAQNAINQDDDDDDKKKYKVAFLPNYEAESIFYGKDNKEVSPEINFFEKLKLV